jgi:hypothetical protein
MLNCSICQLVRQGGALLDRQLLTSFRHLEF